jgi:hypothetical protein
MSVDIKIVEEAKQPMTMNPKKFGMWLFMVTVFMVFAALSSAYIVRRAEGNWTFFELPTLFWVNTVVMLISSATLHWAYLSAKRDNLESVKIATIITTILGLGFMVGQYFAWTELVTNSIHLVGNPSGSFGLHYFRVARSPCFGRGDLFVDFIEFHPARISPFKKPQPDRNVCHVLAFFGRTLAIFVPVPVIVSLSKRLT